MSSPAEIKKALVDAGFELYRTRGDLVHLAERVRENLLMDAGVAVRATVLSVRVTTRAQRTDFPGESEEALFARARTLGAAAIEGGFQEIACTARPILDPSNPDRTLDVACEIVLEKEVPSLDAAIDAARFVMSLPRVAVG